MSLNQGKALSLLTLNFFSTCGELFWRPAKSGTVFGVLGGPFWQEAQGSLSLTLLPCHCRFALIGYRTISAHCDRRILAHHIISGRNRTFDSFVGFGQWVRVRAGFGPNLTAFNSEMHHCDVTALQYQYSRC